MENNWSTSLNSFLFAQLRDYSLKDHLDLPSKCFLAEMRELLEKLLTQCQGIKHKHECLSMKLICLGFTLGVNLQDINLKLQLPLCLCGILGGSKIIESII